ncbi:MAG: HAD family hydrolase [Pseudomonadales bacterium]|jgi:hypothetical protein|nr:HAD family hydrolase [Pseudomonadales bacterium]MDP7357606.1 HAD family hydrolase [Pseudomonadales bacterium]MDP7595029.1 HAD family hydrolase [Pseudomonadales bacterium]HJN51414.1 HAD family hydrolase [Pseudomonadales bacterium]
MHPIEILALDLDGALAVQDHEISAKTRAALTQISQQGIELVIATGRRYRTTRYVIENLGFPVHAVSNGGALIKHRDQSTLQQTCIATDELADMARLARANGHALIAQRDSHANGGADFIVDSGVQWNRPTRFYFEDNGDAAASRDYLDQENVDEYLVFGIFGTHEPLSTFCQLLHRMFAAQFHTVVVPFDALNTWYCEITQAHVTKWSGLTFLADMLKVTPHSICAVGDEINDLAMIRHAGVGVAMGNANPALQKEADWICGNHDEDGLLMVVDYIKEHNGKLR